MRIIPWFQVNKKKRVFTQEILKCFPTAHKPFTGCSRMKKKYRRQNQKPTKASFRNISRGQKVRNQIFSCQKRTRWMWSFISRWRWENSAQSSSRRCPAMSKVPPITTLEDSISATQWWITTQRWIPASHWSTLITWPIILAPHWSILITWPNTRLSLVNT